MTEQGAAEEVLGKVGTWRRTAGTLEIAVLAATAPGVIYTFSFSLCNPPSSHSTGPAYMAVIGGEPVEGRELNIKSTPPHGAGPEQGHSAEEDSPSAIRETQGELDRGWYNTFSGHLRTQYPDEYSGAHVNGSGHRAAGGGGGRDPSGDVLVVGVSSDIVLRCVMANGEE